MYVRSKRPTRVLFCYCELVKGGTDSNGIPLLVVVTYKGSIIIIKSAYQDENHV